MEKKPSVLIVHDHYRIRGGEDTVVENEKKLLESHGHRVRLYERDNTEISDYGIAKKLLLPFLSIYNPRTAGDIKSILKREHYDIVHVHNTLALISPSVYYAAESLRVPVVQTVHNFRLVCANALLYRDGHVCEDCLKKGSVNAVRHACYRDSKIQTFVCLAGLMLHRMTGIYSRISCIFLSDFNKEKILSVNNTKKKYFDPAKAYVKPNFVPDTGNDAQSGLTGDPGRDMHEPEKTRSGFLYVGRPERIKGIRTLIKAWIRLGENAPHLTIIGTGELEGWCRDQIRKHDLNIEMTGYMEHDKVLELMRCSKALIFPTLLYEGNPMSVIEGLSAGIPVIASDIGNAALLIDEGINGTHFKTGSAESLAEAVRQLDRRLKGTGQISMPDIFRPEENYQKLMEIYNKVITKHDGKSHRKN